MIILRTLSWSNCFSYGEETNSIDFDTEKLTQLVGSNGHGKSSIASILELALFNKCSKGIKKDEILNRYTESRSYWIQLEFSKGNTDYTIFTKAGSSKKVILQRDGEDISSHTATDTYRAVQNIIGIDHKAFAQLVYQSNSSSLAFLRSPDTERKKFLIDLLNLEKYTDIGKYFKRVTKELNTELIVVNTKVNTTTAWIEKYSKEDLELQAIEPVPRFDDSLRTTEIKLSTVLANIETTNKAITKNNTYKDLLDKVPQVATVGKPIDNTASLVAKKAGHDKAIQIARGASSKMNILGSKCPTCHQKIDTEELQLLIDEQENIIDIHTKASLNLDANIKENKEGTKTWEAFNDANNDTEKYLSLIDNDLSSILLDKNTLDAELKVMQQKIKELNSTINLAEASNSAATIHNSRVALLLGQLVDMEKEKVEAVVVRDSLLVKLGLLETLNKTFSTTGLVAYRIEALVIDLEQLSNDYLVELSDGRFQIAFQISGNDKLNVVITDTGLDISYNALSMGEASRVNVAVLLAIRKLMSRLYEDKRINLLFLDETTASLDELGKERLIEVLLEEEELNTVLVSHDFTHPLLEKIEVVKIDNISTLTRN